MYGEWVCVILCNSLVHIKFNVVLLQQGYHIGLNLVFKTAT